MQLTVFENGPCTLSCARSTEDHFICERYKDQIIPSKGKSINVMAECCSATEWQQRACSPTPHPPTPPSCINEQWVDLNKPLENSPHWGRVNYSVSVKVVWMFACLKQSSVAIILSMRWTAISCSQGITWFLVSVYCTISHRVKHPQRQNLADKMSVTTIKW